MAANSHNAGRAARASFFVATALFAVSMGTIAAFGGCAQGTTLTSGSGGSGGSTTTTTSSTGGGGSWVGTTCESSDQCPEGGQCVSVGGQKICTQTCPPDCPSGSYCTLIEGDPVCVPEVDSQCGQCLGSAQCKGITDECLTAPDGDKFCARDCTTISDCPTGYICMARSDYEALAAGAGGNGGSGGSGGNGAAGGGGNGGTAGGPPDAGAGGKPPTGIPYKFCVPPDSHSCACNDRRDGVTKNCDIKNEYGHCAGTETCDGKGGAWVGCTAKTPAPESCNSEDDDCNGAVDEGEADVICGGTPPNGHYACNAGACDLDTCDDGWTAYPPGLPGDGCNCKVDANEPNDTCASPANAGNVMDTGAPIQLLGTLSSDTDVDVWVIDTIDVNQMTTNSYHVSIDLLPGAGSDAILLDVIRGDSCSDDPTGPATGITSYDWCVDGKSADGLAGEAPCSATGAIHCNDNSSKYFVRVYRKPGSPSVCQPYSITVSAQGGDPCDFDTQCL